MIYNQPEIPKKLLLAQKKKRQSIYSIILLSLTAIILFFGIMADWLLGFFVGPIGSSIAIPLSLIIAVVSFLFRRSIHALLISGAIILCCLLSLMCTTLILSKWHISFLETVEIVFLYWYNMLIK